MPARRLLEEWFWEKGDKNGPRPVDPLFKGVLLATTTADR
jgi:hypothetical protein